jgi:hypothetical protein
MSVTTTLYDQDGTKFEVTALDAPAFTLSFFDVNEGEEFEIVELSADDVVEIARRMLAAVLSRSPGALERSLLARWITASP